MVSPQNISSAPKVVAVIPAYNPGVYLKESVESLLAQTPAIPHIVVIDDGCSDGSIDQLLDWEREGRIEIHRNPQNLGKAESLNRAFTIYEADYFIIQDADDVAKPERVARQLAFMEENPDVGCSSSFVDYISSNGTYVAEGKLDLLDDDRLAEYLAGDEPFGLYCPAVILRASVVKNPSLQFREQFWPADDIDLWNRIAESGHKVRAQPENLVCYRVHGNSAVTSGFARTRMQFEWLRACLRARRTGRPEPSKDEFLAIWNSAPWWKRWNRSRKFLAKGFYRAAGFAAAEKSYLKAAAKAMVALVLQPSYSLRRAVMQLRGRFL
ncbi:MAG: glycosyltransferase [Akkermansiaceae bacterium]|nr:glycosyltransferase [Akkermansiaceae bacterium]MDP4778833.1 glycosyltransferase [Akkermansiaceae bacterium]